MNKLRIILLLITTFTLFYSCNKLIQKDGLQEGIITYEIRYLHNEMDNIGTPLLPKKMILKFNSSKSVSTIDGFLGFLRISNITNFQDKNARTLLKVFENEYIFIGEKGETICCYDAMEDMNIDKTNDTTNIAGLKARKAIAKLPSGETFDVYYTHEIAIENPNATNPYHQIDGVLLDFQLTMNELKMRFIADKIEESPIGEKDFEVFNNPKRISRESMSKVMNKLME
ncbi:MAG: hypothetical protein GVY19_07230 [Bacteroidetes bacterium]|jgi:GLPGLI family protein|nr:hypothetical protein [Bacteroidota bacterium]